MVDVVLQGVWVLYHVNKDEGDESQALLAFRRDFVNATFLKYSKEGRLSSSHVGIQNIPSDFVMMTQNITRRIQNTFKHLTCSVFEKPVNRFKVVNWLRKNTLS